MRAAGCVINDIADPHIDKHITRTRLRPLTSGELSLSQAFTVLILLLCAALFVAINLPKNCIYLAIFSLMVTFIYPFCKRFVQAPQMVLGLAFSMGIPMAYVASGVVLDQQFYLLFIINFAWILAYDTMYAMTDKPDDLKIGVKSTAIYFAQYDCLIIGLLQLIFHCLWLFLGVTSQVAVGFYLFWAAGSLVLFISNN